MTDRTSRRLALRRERLAELTAEELATVAGGVTAGLTGTETMGCPTLPVNDCYIPVYTHRYPCTGTGM